MTDFYIHSQNGQILNTGSVPDHDIANQPVPQGCALVVGTAVFSKHYHSASGPVLIAPQPGEYCIFDYTIKAWVDPRTLADRKAQKWSSIKMSRQAAEASGFTCNAHVYDSDPASATRISAAVQLAMIAKSASQPFSINWTLADNTIAVLDTAGMIAAGEALGAHIEVQQAKARGLRAQIEAAADVAALDLIVW
jgi:hypothetical protein